MLAAQHPARQLADGATSLRTSGPGGGRPPPGQMHHRHRVLQPDHLLCAVHPGRGPVRPERAGQPVRPCTRMAAVELGRDLNGQRARSCGGRSEIGVSVAEAKYRPFPRNTAACRRMADSIDGVIGPCRRGAGDAESCVHAARKTPAPSPRYPMVRSPWTFRVPRAGTPGAGRRSAAQGSIGDLSAMVATAWVLLGQAHRPAHDRAAGRGHHLRDARSVGRPGPWWQPAPSDIHRAGGGDVLVRSRGTVSAR